MAAKGLAGAKSLREDVIRNFSKMTAQDIALNLQDVQCRVAISQAEDVEALVNAGPYVERRLKELVSASRRNARAMERIAGALERIAGDEGRVKVEAQVDGVVLNHY